jgi:hypothetical protein
MELHGMTTNEGQRRILPARISDALAGLSMPSGPIERRLEWLTGATVSLSREDVQTIRTEVKVVGSCPGPVIPVVLQVAHEMVDNAARHGMHLRLIGHIFVSLWAFPDFRVSLTVRDDGWGPGAEQIGDGHSIMASLAGQFGGSVSLTRKGCWTVATMSIPTSFDSKASGPAATSRDSSPSGAA